MDSSGDPVVFLGQRPRHPSQAQRRIDLGTGVFAGYVLVSSGWKKLIFPPGLNGKMAESSTSGSTTARPSSFCFTSLICHSDRFLRLLTMRPWSRSPLFVTSTRCVKACQTLGSRRSLVPGSKGVQFTWRMGALAVHCLGFWREKLFETVAAKLAKEHLVGGGN
jgi:hypothetical protein